MYNTRAHRDVVPVEPGDALYNTQNTHTHRDSYYFYTTYTTSNNAEKQKTDEWQKT